MSLDLKRGTISHGDVVHSCYIARNFTEKGIIHCVICMDYYYLPPPDAELVAQLKPKIARFLTEGHGK